MAPPSRGTAPPGDELRIDRVTPRAILFAAVIVCVAAFACSKDATAPRGGDSGARAYVMGFSGIGPSLDVGLTLDAILMWSQRADAAIMSNELPWDSLLAGVRPDSFVIRNELPLARYYRGRGFNLLVMIDPGNGLNRAGEATALVNAGRSITEPAIQQLYRRYVAAVDSVLAPDELGLALETNLIRAVAPAPLYAAVKRMANDAAADVRARDPRVKPMVSVQVETAWGRLQHSNTYIGVEQDFADFPFIQILGLSSYPYLGSWMRPEDLPDDYYSRLTQGHPLPVMVTEGGWSSRTVSDVVTTPEMQRRYIVREAQLLDRADAAGWFQLTFTDLDTSAWPPGIVPFAYNGLVDSTLAPKPALAPWDSLFSRRRR